ncbi:MAG: ATP-binding protein [Nitrospirota bacterium]|nr:ATP-binding protein [Nitrospirota bacterium]
MRNFRYTVFLVAVALLIIAVFGVEIHYMGIENVPFLTKLMLFVLLNLNLLAMLVLMFFVGKSLVKIYLERKHRVPGYKFKTKFVVVLVGLTLIPSAFLFIISSGIVTNYLDRWFDPQIKEPLDQSVEIAKSVYEMQREQTLLFAKALVSGKRVPDNYTVRRLKDIPEDATETVTAGFNGKSATEVITGADGDFIRAVVPEYDGKKQTGVVIVESFMSGDISRNAEKIKETYKNYLTLESWKSPIKMNYLLILIFFTSLIVFMALWVALRISRGITDPIQALARSTEQVAKGNLDIEIDINRDDEIGLLVRSFNHMVKEMKAGKESLQYAYLESDRRRLIIENILENINSGVISLDTAGNILTVNSAACAILNITPEEILNKNYMVLLSMLNSEELKKTVKNIRIKEFKGVEKEIRANINDKRILLRVFITSLMDRENFLGTIVVFDDLTEIVRAQKALAWEEVARRVAHEIKNPLTPIKLSTDHMIKKWQNRDDDFGKVFERSTKTIIKEVESLKRLVNEFSRFGKMPEINKSPVLISTIIEGIANLYKDYKELEIRVSKQEDEPPVELDPEQFKRVIINIVDNAIEAMQNKGRIHIAINHDIASNRAYVDIEDDGPGILGEDKEKLFLPYFSTKKDGTGLGLAIAGRVITEHRGYIRIKDNKPRGTIFAIELPIKEG